MRRRTIFSWAMLLLAHMIVIHPSVAAPRCFPETNQCLDGRFREYWEQNGSLPVFGFPITKEQSERNRDAGDFNLTQWFERNRFERHFENRAPYDVLLGRLGDDRLRQLGRNWQSEPREGGSQSGCLWFEQTGRNVCDQGSNVGFKTYWQTHGLEFDGKRGTSFEESLALFGLPLTSPQMETNASGDNVMTQWFERARFEWHSNNPDQYKVLLGLLGNEIRPEVQQPRVLASGFGQDGRYVGYGFIVENPNQNYALQLEYQVAVYDASGVVLSTDSHFVETIAPGQKVGVAGDRILNEGQRATRIEVQVSVDDPQIFFPGDVPILVGENATYIPGDFSDKVTGTIRNTSQINLKTVRTNAILYNASGQIIGGGYTYVDFVPANATSAASISVTTAEPPTRVEIYPVVTNLSLPSSN